MAKMFHTLIMTGHSNSTTQGLWKLIYFILTLFLRLAFYCWQRLLSRAPDSLQSRGLEQREHFQMRSRSVARSATALCSISEAHHNRLIVGAIKGTKESGETSRIANLNLFTTFVTKPEPSILWTHIRLRLCRTWYKCLLKYNFALSKCFCSSSLWYRIPGKE